MKAINFPPNLVDHQNCYYLQEVLPKEEHEYWFEGFDWQNFEDKLMFEVFVTDELYFQTEYYSMEEVIDELMISRGFKYPNFISYDYLYGTKAI